MDVQEQLSLLRRRIARIDRKYAGKPAQVAPPPRFDSRPARYFVEDLITGQVADTAYGAHFETEKLYERHRRHGSMDLSNLIELPEDLLESLSGVGMYRCHPTRWAFLDTETTGLAGGAGTYAFLVGIGGIDEAGFRIRQFFMRDLRDEASLLHAVAEHLARFDVLVTYNGKAYDQPLLEGRYRLARLHSPFARLEHLDLLFGARRLWKLRLESCRLIDLENRILGVERQGDLPGEMIPYHYFDYLHSKQAFRLVPIFHHNATDILSLACLTAVAPFAFRKPEEAALAHGADCIGLARWLIQDERFEESLRLLRRGVDLGLPDSLLFRTLWDIAMIEKKLGRAEAALAVFADLAVSPNPCRVQALEEMAKHYERNERNCAAALEMTRKALALVDSPALRKREERLKARLARPRNRRASPSG
ncbi:MAG: ribonuclease H-like domain-containing protein [Bryobacteraceae bacterium]